MESISAAMAALTVLAMHFYFIVIHLYDMCSILLELMVHPPLSNSPTPQNPHRKRGAVESISAAMAAETVFVIHFIL